MNNIPYLALDIQGNFILRISDKYRLFVFIEKFQLLICSSENAWFPTLIGYRLLHQILDLNSFIFPTLIKLTDSINYFMLKIDFSWTMVLVSCHLSLAIALIYQYSIINVTKKHGKTWMNWAIYLFDHVHENMSDQNVTYTFSNKSTDFCDSWLIHSVTSLMG